MARYSASPSPPEFPGEHRRRRAPAAVNGYESRRIANGSLSRSRSPQLAPDEPPRERRRRRHASDAPRPRRAERYEPEMHEPADVDTGRRGEMKSRERTRRRDRTSEDDEPERSRGRRGGHDKDRDSQHKMAEAQRMMMSGMMHPMQMAMMQMGHMGMMHPSYMAAMQQQQKQMKRDSRKRNKQPTEGQSCDESSSDSSSSDSSGPETGVMGQAAAMAAMAAMQQHHWHAPAAQAWQPPPQAPLPPPQATEWKCSSCGFNNAPRNKICGGNGPMGCKAPRDKAAEPQGRPPPPPPPGHPGPAGYEKEIEAFLAANPVEEDAADRLRALPPHLATSVIARGPVSDSRDPTAVLLARLRAVEINRPPGEGQNAAISAASANDPRISADTTAPARRSAKSAIEKMIDDYRLSPGCAWMMRSLPPDKQKMVAKIDPAGQADPSAYVAEELRKIV